MVEAWLIGGSAAHARIELETSLPSVLPVILRGGETVNYHYVGELALGDKTVHLFRHDSVRPEEITSFVRLRRGSPSDTRSADRDHDAGYSPPRSPVTMRYV